LDFVFGDIRVARKESADVASPSLEAANKGPCHRCEADGHQLSSDSQQAASDAAPAIEMGRSSEEVEAPLRKDNWVQQAIVGSSCAINAEARAISSTSPSPGDTQRDIPTLSSQHLDAVCDDSVASACQSTTAEVSEGVAVGSAVEDKGLGVHIMHVGQALYCGDADAQGRPHGRGTLLLPDGAAHRGRFVAGRAQGPGELTTPTGLVFRGEWHANRRIGRFEARDAMGKLWTEQYDSSGKRVERKCLDGEPPGAAATLCSKCQDRGCHAGPHENISTAVGT